MIQCTLIVTYATNTYTKGTKIKIKYCSTCIHSVVVVAFLELWEDQSSVIPRFTSSIIKQITQVKGLALTQRNFRRERERKHSNVPQMNIGILIVLYIHVKYLNNYFTKISFLSTMSRCLHLKHPCSAKMSFHDLLFFLNNPGIV